ncbi:MAG: GtrA family protein [Clostridia bacterium]|nr:GtrA family protein [Clostridia bacterium]
MSEEIKNEKNNEQEVLTPAQQKLKRKNEIIRIVKFVLFSASAGIIQFTSCTLLFEVAKLEYVWSYIISVVLSVLWNFTFNRKFTFKSASNIPIAMLKVAAFYLVFTPLSALWSWALEDLCGWNEYLVLAPTMIINMVTEYLYCTYFVFKNSMNTNKLGQKENEELKKAGIIQEATNELQEENVTETENKED